MKPPRSPLSFTSSNNPIDHSLLGDEIDSAAIELGDRRKSPDCQRIPQHHQYRAVAPRPPDGNPLVSRPIENLPVRHSKAPTTRRRSDCDRLKKSGARRRAAAVVGQDKNIRPQVFAASNQRLFGAHLEIAGYEQPPTAGLDPHYE